MTALPANLADLIDQTNRAVLEMRAENDRHLEDIKKGMSDVVRSEKIDRINADISTMQAAIDKLNIQLAANQMNISGEQKIGNPEYTKHFVNNMKTGKVNAMLEVEDDSKGGYLVPTEWDRTITTTLLQISPMRRICDTKSTTLGRWQKMFTQRGTTSGWVGEKDPRPETSTSTFQPLTFEVEEQYAQPKVTQRILDDSNDVDLEAWLTEEVTEELAFQEGIAFLTGNGDKKPIGILNYVAGGTHASHHPYGAIEAIASGNATSITSDSIIRLTHSLPTENSADAVFIMNNLTLQELRLLKDGQGNYLWQPSFQAGTPQSLGGYSVIEVPGMPLMAANSIPILFGNFKKTYQIRYKEGTSVQRDALTEKGFVKFYTTKRVGGGLVHTQHLKALKVQA